MTGVKFRGQRTNSSLSLSLSARLLFSFTCHACLFFPFLFVWITLCPTRPGLVRTMNARCLQDTCDAATQMSMIGVSYRICLFLQTERRRRRKQGGNLSRSISNQRLSSSTFTCDILTQRQLLIWHRKGCTVQQKWNAARQRRRLMFLLKTRHDLCGKCTLCAIDKSTFCLFSVQTIERSSEVAWTVPCKDLVEGLALTSKIVMKHLMQQT